MFDNLSDRLSQSLRKITGKAKLTDDNIQETLREVRMALLEADVALPVVKDFRRIRAPARRGPGGQQQPQSRPGLRQDRAGGTGALMGAANESLNLAAQPPAVILMAGLQGAGKTTSVAKLARWLKEREKKKVMVVSADVYRPAAIKQLETLAGEVGVEFLPQRRVPEAGGDCRGGAGRGAHRSSATC